MTEVKGDLAESAASHRIPVIDKAVRVLLALEGSKDGLSVVGLSRELNLSRTTVYRMLNTLTEHGIVARRDGGTRFALGPALVRLARRVTVAPDAVSVCRPLIEHLARESGQTVKVSVLENGQATVVAVAPGSGSFSIAAQVGRTFPLHAGAASKLLLAHAAPEVLARVLASELSRHTAKTILDAAALLADLDQVRRQGWAEDRGEFVEGVRAFGVPVRDATDMVVAAISITFLSGLGDHAALLQHLLRAGERATLELAG